MLNIGSYNELVVEREVDFGFYLNPKEDEVLLPSKYAPENLQPGDSIKVFIYTDSEDRPVATTLTPKAVVGDYVSLTLKENTPIGAFMDWGLEKDLLVPVNEQQYEMTPGKSYVVKVCLDKSTDRVYASARISAHSNSDTTKLNQGEKVSLLICSISEIGIMAVINNEYTGILYKNETFEDLAPGDIREGYISKIREDGKIDLSLKKPGYKSVINSADKILEKLKEANGFLPFNDKSSPDEIKTAFSISKKEFKRTIGGLYKQGLVDITKDGLQIKP